MKSSTIENTTGNGISMIYKLTYHILYIHIKEIKSMYLGDYKKL